MSPLAVASSIPDNDFSWHMQANDTELSSFAESYARALREVLPCHAVIHILRAMHGPFTVVTTVTLRRSDEVDAAEKALSAGDGADVFEMSDYMKPYGLAAIDTSRMEKFSPPGYKDPLPLRGFRGANTVEIGIRFNITYPSMPTGIQVYCHRETCQD